ncbi:RsmD family RNA methyltransferase [Plasmodium falciparum Santa Lucia]|uniref:RsmD family RNA methyltransferase n=1 Tax=Plasmodium falciparum Santa Lucia TaxID=478859 RepID=W7FRH6_PLAFA|nr:RsmD family RNA methyltransferase [Plasmodium falciparum Santa Lucia]
MIFVKHIFLLYIISLFLNNLNTLCNSLKSPKKKHIGLLYKLSKRNNNKNVAIKKKLFVFPLCFIKVYPFIFKNKVAFQNVEDNYVYTLKRMERNKWRMQDERKVIQNEQNVCNNTNKGFSDLDGNSLDAARYSKNIVENMNHTGYKKDSDHNNENINKKDSNHNNENINKKDSDHNNENINKKYSDHNNDSINKKDSDHNNDSINKKDSDNNNDTINKKDSDHNNDNINKKDNDHNNNINACNNNGKVSSKGKKRIIETDMYGLPKEKLNIKRQTNKNIKSKYGYCKIKTYNETINVNYRKKKILSILEGTLKNKRLYSPDTYTRPMMSKVKESIFNILTHLNILNGYNINVLDVFTGSGNLGIECISRDVKNVTFVDLSLNSCRTVFENLRLCNIYDTNKKIIRADAMELLQNPYKFNVHEKYNLGFFTPPYEQIIYSDLIHNISNSKLFEEDGLIFIEYPKEINLLPKKVGNLIGLRNRKFGRTYYTLYVINSTGKYIPYQNENEFYPLHYNRKQRRQEKYIE